jgi:hypothetical protein
MTLWQDRHRAAVAADRASRIRTERARMPGPMARVGWTPGPDAGYPATDAHRRAADRRADMGRAAMARDAAGPRDGGLSAAWRGLRAGPGVWTVIAGLMLAGMIAAGTPGTPSTGRWYGPDATCPPYSADDRPDPAGYCYPD